MSYSPALERVRVEKQKAAEYLRLIHNLPTVFRLHCESVQPFPPFASAGNVFIHNQRLERRQVRWDRQQRPFSTGGGGMPGGAMAAATRRMTGPSKRTWC